MLCLLPREACPFLIRGGLDGWGVMWEVGGGNERGGKLVGV